MSGLLTLLFVAMILLVGIVGTYFGITGLCVLVGITLVANYVVIPAFMFKSRAWRKNERP